MNKLSPSRTRAPVPLDDVAEFYDMGKNDIWKIEVLLRKRHNKTWPASAIEREMRKARRNGDTRFPLMRRGLNRGHCLAPENRRSQP